MDDTNETNETVLLPLDRWLSYTRKIPYGVVKTGYVVNPKDSLELIPEPETVFWIEKAFDYIEAGNSFREVAEWLSQKIHRTVSHQTMSNLYGAHRKPYTKTKTNRRTRVKVSRDTRKLISEKLKAIGAVKRANKLEKELAIKRKQIQPTDYTTPPVGPVHKPTYTVTDTDPNKTRINVLFKPNEGPQERFLEAIEDEVLYGGAAGGEDKVFLPPPFAVMHQNKTRELSGNPKRAISSQA